MGSIDRRQFLKLGAGLGAVISLTGCRALLERISQFSPPPTPAPTATVQPSPTATAAPLLPPTEASPLPTATHQPVTAAPPSRLARLKRPASGSKLGVHVVFGPRDGLDDFLAQCAEAGQPVAVVKCVDDFEAAFHAKRYSAKTFTVGRVNSVRLTNKNFADMQAWEPAEFNPPKEFHYATAQEAARQYYGLVKPIWLLNPVIDAWETFNEFSWHWPWQADFYLELMDLAEADGFRLGLWSPSAGNPPEEFYPDIARTCRRAKAHGDHIMCVHEYGLAGLLKDAPHSLVTRYRSLYKFLEQEDAVIPLVISEAGENAGGGFTGVETFLTDFAWYDEQLTRDSYVIGCAAWTLGDFNGANFMAALPAMTDYVIGRPIHYGPQAYLPLITNGQGK
jgi:hypothetical protein